jgi:hypothetical protein
MKRPSYRAGVAWIADNNQPNEEDPEAVSASHTTRLLAVLFERDEKLIAFDVLTKRRLMRIDAENSEELDDFDDDESAFDQE